MVLHHEGGKKDALPRTMMPYPSLLIRGGTIPVPLQPGYSQIRRHNKEGSLSC